MHWKQLPVLALPIVAFVAAPAHAQEIDWGPPPGPIEITCDRVAVDPPSIAYVTHHITVNGVAYERSVWYGATEPGLAIVDISDLTTEVDVEYHITDYATWNLGSGQTPTFEETLVCHQSTPTTTTPPTTTPPTTAPPAPPPTVGGVTVTPTAPVPAEPPQVLASEVDATLPTTGTTDVGGLAAVGVGLLASGGLVLFRARRPRKA